MNESNQSFRALSTDRAEAAFDKLVKGLTRQHTGTRFRNHFGSGELGFDGRTFAAGANLIELTKPVKNALQELPENVKVTRFTRQDGNVRALRGRYPDASTFEELLAPTEIEQALIIAGKKATLFVYWDPTREDVYVVRTVPEPPGGAKPRGSKSPRV